MQIVGRTNSGESIVYMSEPEVRMLNRLVEVCGNVARPPEFYMGIDPDYGPIEDYLDAVAKSVSVQYRVRELRRIANELESFHTVREALAEDNAQHPRMGE